MRLLETINSPQDLKKLELSQLPQLADEIRDFLIENVLRTGGHLSPNLGVVELTIALHYVFDSPTDNIIWDVGHQSYVHKILTGRRGDFTRLRKAHGLSGYPNPGESEHDIIHAGHSSTSLSIASGIARARKVAQEAGDTIAVIGDGSFTAGLVYEALNTISHQALPVIIILNDNGMSISENVGGISAHFNRIRTSKSYVKFKRRVEHLVGKPLRRFLYNIKESIKQVLTPNTFFHDLGIAYYGPFDGHDIAKLVDIFNEIKGTDKPLLLHMVTQKGKGHRPAEDDPCHFHGIAGLSVNGDDSIPLVKEGISYSKLFGNILRDMAEKDEKIFAVTAAMKTGTGLSEYASRFPERFADVGIAEQHAVDFGVGLSLRGFKPVVAIYSTFLQRGYDQLLHDVGIGNIPVLFCLDRAGLVPDDGETHQGIFDIAYLRMIPHFRILLPACAGEFRLMMEYALEHFKYPYAIRYPKDTASDFPEYPAENYPIKEGQGVVVSTGKDIIVVSTGTVLREVLEAGKRLKDENIHLEIFNLRFAKPINKSVVDYLTADDRPVLILEEGIASGGVSEYLISEILRIRPGKKTDYTALPDEFPPVQTRDALLAHYRLTARKIADKIKLLLEK